MTYWQEFLIIATVHFLAVASPGPDFAIVLKQSIRYGRRCATFTSLGIGAGILVHVAYSLVGIGLLIATDEHLFNLLKYIAAAYFLYVAWHGLNAKAQSHEKKFADLHHENKMPSTFKAFLTRFLINALNVKATLFFVSLFSMVISIQTPLFIKLFYGIYMALATAAWFSLLSYLLNMKKFKQLILKKGYWLERFMGLVLLILAIELLLTNL